MDQLYDEEYQPEPPQVEMQTANFDGYEKRNASVKPNGYQVREMD
jgi:hypothetical protein